MDDAEDRNDRLTYEVASATVPFLDVAPYEILYEDRPKERRLGTSNYF